MLALLLAALLASPDYQARAAAVEYLRAHPGEVWPLFAHSDPEVRNAAAVTCPCMLDWSEWRLWAGRYEGLPYLDSLPGWGNNDAHRLAVDDARCLLRWHDWPMGGGGRWAEYRLGTYAALELGLLWPDGLTLLVMMIRTRNWDRSGKWE